MQRLAGAPSWVRTQVLDSDPELELKVYVVWNPSPGGVDPWPSPFPGLAPDDRITEYWDSGQVAAQWFASDIGSGTVAYDAYYLFGPEARWDDELPAVLSTAVDDDFLSGLPLRRALEALFPSLG